MRMEELRIEKVSNELYEVYSEGNTHQVINVDGEWICTCTDWFFEGKCEHIDAVLELIKMGRGSVKKCKRE